jgi:transcriptional regulator GlxA family with amidase domain
METLQEMRPLRRGLEGVFALAAASYHGPLTLDKLAAAAGMPSTTLTRRFHRRFGISPMRWLWSFRVLLAAELIAAAPAAPLAEVAERCGFVSPAHFSRRFRELFGESPSKFRQAARRATGTTGGDDVCRRELDEWTDAALVRRALAKTQLRGWEGRG